MLWLSAIPRYLPYKKNTSQVHNYKYDIRELRRIFSVYKQTRGPTNQPCCSSQIINAPITDQKQPLYLLTHKIKIPLTSFPNSPHQACSPGQENKQLWQSSLGHQCICHSVATSRHVSTQLPMDLLLTSEVVH